MIVQYKVSVAQWFNILIQSNNLVRCLGIVRLRSALRVSKGRGFAFARIKFTRKLISFGKRILGPTYECSCASYITLIESGAHFSHHAIDGLCGTTLFVKRRNVGLLLRVDYC